MTISRRTVLGAAGAAAAAAALAACSPEQTSTSATSAVKPASPSSDDTTSSAGSGAGAGAKATTGAPGTTTTTPAGSEAVGTLPPTAPAASGPVGAAAFVNHGDRNGTAVALTFHAAGDTGLATQLLDLLAQQKVLVTVFGVGQWLQQNPATAKRIMSDGHELANHTFTHQAMGHLNRAQIADEIKRCADVLTGYTGSISPWFRPSGIEIPTPDILAEAGKVGYKVSVGYDLDSLDFQDPGTAAVVHNVNSAVKAGSIISLHFSHANTVAALPAILDHLRQSGLKPVTVSQLLA